MNEITLAKILMKIEDCLESSESSFEEKFYDAAVNRSYYAMFHAVQLYYLFPNLMPKLTAGRIVSSGNCL